MEVANGAINDTTLRMRRCGEIVCACMPHGRVAKGHEESGGALIRRVQWRTSYAGCSGTLVTRACLQGERVAGHPYALYLALIFQLLESWESLSEQNLHRRAELRIVDLVAGGVR